MRKITFILLMFLCIFEIGAQETSASEEAAKKKEINGIKLGEQAVYAEVYEVAADDEAALRLAQRKSVNMLEARIIEASSEQLGMSKEDMKAIFDVIDDKCQNIVIKKGDMIRVFSYIMKDKIGFSKKKPSSKDLKEYFEEDNDSIAIQEQLEKAAEKVMEGQDSINYVAHQANIEILPKDTIVEEKESVFQEEIQKKNAPKEEVKKVEDVSVVQQQPEIEIPDLCQTMIAKENFVQLRKFLQNEKRYQRLMFANSNTMQSIENCYIVIIEKASNKIVSVLDKGENDRMNFVTKKMDNFRNYRRSGYAAIFVQEYK